MAEVVLSRGADADLDRLVVFLGSGELAAALATYGLVLGALEVLRTYPSIGRPVDDVLRELVISRGSTRYLALYEYDSRTPGRHSCVAPSARGGLPGAGRDGIMRN